MKLAQFWYFYKLPNLCDIGNTLCKHVGRNLVAELKFEFVRFVTKTLDLRLDVG